MNKSTLFINDKLVKKTITAAIAKINILKTVLNKTQLSFISSLNKKKMT